MSQPNGRPDLQRGQPQVPPTLATVAHEAGVSRQTVSNALNNPDLTADTPETAYIPSQDSQPKAATLGDATQAATTGE